MAAGTVAGFGMTVCLTVALAGDDGPADSFAIGRLQAQEAPLTRAISAPNVRRASPPAPGSGAATGSAYARFADWAADTASSTGSPARALTAYAAAVELTDVQAPGCRLNWATLAGIGQIESRSGAMGGGLQTSGVPRRPIYGVALDGSGPVAAIADSDDGRLDAAATVDRAVGPLQFLPSTWATWSSDGDGDGVRDPQDIDDASLAAARYLCATGSLDTAAGWTTAVLSYNHSSDYLDAVFAATQDVAIRSRS